MPVILDIHRYSNNTRIPYISVKKAATSNQIGKESTAERKTDRRLDKGTGAVGVDSQNTRLEVQHQFKEIASLRAL